MISRVISYKCNHVNSTGHIIISRVISYNCNHVYSTGHITDDPSSCQWPTGGKAILDGAGACLREKNCKQIEA